MTLDTVHCKTNLQRSMHIWHIFCTCGERECKNTSSLSSTHLCTHQLSRSGRRLRPGEKSESDAGVNWRSPMHVPRWSSLFLHAACIHCTRYTQCLLQMHLHEVRWSQSYWWIIYSTRTCWCFFKWIKVHRTENFRYNVRWWCPASERSRWQDQIPINGELTLACVCFATLGKWSRPTWKHKAWLTLERVNIPPIVNWSIISK
jgi:hypothetical protein